MNRIELHTQNELNSKVTELLKEFEGRGYILFLSGGDSSFDLYKYLSRSTDYPFPAAVAQVDERMDGVTSHPKSNYLMHHKSGVINRAVKEHGSASNYYHMNKEQGIELDLQNYEKTLNDLFANYKNSVAIMGMGMDGHTAGILPESLAVMDSQHLVEAYHTEDEFKLRMTITPKCIKENISKVILLLVGEEKIRRFDRIWGEENDVYNYPVLVYKDIKDLNVLCLYLPTLGAPAQGSLLQKILRIFAK
jgi:6-phosphogluconolactonase/glucosamine-6-phosphate isomerase/deaminase